MTRAALFAALLTAMLAGASRADVEVAPPPRPKGVPFAPPPHAAKAEDPAETVGKIIKNSKDVTDRLAKSDTSTTTRKTQDETLALIDSLINREENPPPPKDDRKQDDKDKKDEKDKDKKDDQKQKGDGQPKNGNDGKGGKGGMNDMEGMSQPKGGGMGEPKDQGQGKSGRRPRAESGKEPGGKQQPQPGAKDGGKEPGKEASGEPKSADGKNPNRGDVGKLDDGKPKPSLPVDDDVAKDVWGHLPDKLRQQVTQYYKEEFMPRYADLLKQYYSSLSERGGKPGDPKK